MSVQNTQGRSSGSPRLADIPFEETRPVEPKAPAWKGLLSFQKIERQKARHYWIKLPLEGAINTATHEILRHLPSSFVSAFGGTTSTLAQWRYRHRIFARRIARNLYALAPDLAETKVQRTHSLAAWWNNIGRTVAEFSKANDLWREGRISIKGLENLEEARVKGTPLIFVSMHLATWEAAFTAIHEGLASPSIGPFQPEPSRFTNQIVHKLRKRRRQYLFPPGQRSAIRLHKLLRAGEVSLTIFIDEVRDKQIHMPLFGRLPPQKGNAVVAIKLANTCGGTIIPFYMKRKTGALFDLNILPPLIPDDNGSSYEITATLNTLNRIFEPLVISNIQHWYMLGQLYLPNAFEDDTARKAHLLAMRRRETDTPLPPQAF